MMNEASERAARKTTALNSHLPTHLWVTETPGLEAELDQAAANGWTPDGLAAWIVHRCGPQAGSGVVVSLIRQAARTPQAKGTEPVRAGLIIDAHPFTQDPDNMGGWCRCGLPRANRHHTGDN